MKKRFFIAVGVLFAFTFVLTACNKSVSNDNGNEKVAQNSVKELVQKYSGKSFENENASITSDELVVDNKGNKTVYPLPEDEFFVSIAPYIEKTHPCGNHNLTGCQGELKDKKFDVVIQDEDGNMVVNQTMTSLSNGFMDFWLPRNKTYQVKITYDGKTAESKISTFKGDNTCITTMQLL